MSESEMKRTKKKEILFFLFIKKWRTEKKTKKN